MTARLRALAEGLFGGVIGLLMFGFVLAQIVAFALPVVREHCLNVAASESQQRVMVDTKWTVLAWPPPPFASLDPTGRCVRNGVGRELLAEAGVWALPSRQEQVRQHVADQLTAP